MTCPKSQGGFQIDDLWTLKPVVFWWHQNSSSGVPSDSPLDEADDLTLDACYNPTPANLFLILFFLLSSHSFPHLALFLEDILVQPTQDLQSHKQSWASPVCWNPVSLWIFVDSTVQWASAFWWLSYFFVSLSNILCIIGFLCSYNFLFLCQAYVCYSILHFLWHSVEAKRTKPGVRKSVAWTLFDYMNCANKWFCFSTS